MKSLKIKNIDLEALIKATTIDLNFERSRVRNQFVKSLEPAIELKEKSRKEIIDKFCKKDKDGKPILNNGMYEFEDIEKVNAEYNKLMQEEITIDIPSNIEEKLMVIKDIIIGNDRKIPMGESRQLEVIVDALDSISKKK
jgi:hypothetical protein